MASNGSAPEYPEPAFDQLPDSPSYPSSSATR